MACIRGAVVAAASAAVSVVVAAATELGALMAVGGVRRGDERARLVVC